MTRDSKRIGLVKDMLGIEPETITTVTGVLSRTPLTPDGPIKGIRWSGVVITTGERLGYCDATPGVLYYLPSATH